MCETNQYITLSESQQCQITYCKCCKAFSVTFNSCCASFSWVELIEFRTILESLIPEDFQYQLMGKSMAIVKNPFICIGFCLTEADVEELVGALKESEVLFDAFHVIYK